MKHDETLHEALDELSREAARQLGNPNSAATQRAVRKVLMKSTGVKQVVRERTAALAKTAAQ